MANRVFLCSSPTPDIYPSFVQASYDSDEQTIATDVYAVPLPWMALFRASDLQARTFNVDGETVSAEAPVAAKPRALDSLEEAVVNLQSVFRAEGSLKNHASYLAEAITQAPGEFVTIELSELSCLYPSEQEFFSLFRNALQAIGDPGIAEGKAVLARLADLRLGRPFPPADLLVRDLEAVDDDYWNHCRILGTGRLEGGIGRPDPWEAD
jgi:hypothetical protein